MRRALIPALLATLVVTAACGGGEASNADATGSETSENVVTMSLLDFSPETVKVAKGETVTWKNGSAIEHVLVQGTYEVDGNGLRTSQQDDGTFSLKVSKKGQSVEHMYDEAGSFDYFCTIHKGMNGTVEVA